MHAVIVLGGEPPSPALTKQVCKTADFVIAADRGFNALNEAGLKPDVLVGDFDSIGDMPDKESCGFRVVEASEQTATDFEKALRFVSDDATSLTLLGGTGLRSDHFLTNLLIASALPSPLRVTFIDAVQRIERVTSDCAAKIAVAHGDIVSLIPFASCDGVVTSGLRWNLDNTHMGAPDQLGQSNVAEADTVSVTLTDGLLFVIANQPQD